MNGRDIVLSCRNLSVGYAGKTVLSGLDFDFPAGSMTVLIGANGSGKSTLLRTLAGQQDALAGIVELGGRALQTYSRRDLARVRAIVTTSREGGGGLTVDEAVAVGRYAYTGWTGMLTAEDRKVVSEAMESVGVGDFAGRYLANLSDGERQKVMIARALAQQTPLLILDEPTAFLDVAARIEIVRLLRNLARDGKTIILSTHDIAPSVAHADMILAVDSERCTAELAPKETMIANGVLDKVFAGAGLHFDVAASDFR